MKKILKIAAPFLLIAAAFVSQYIGTEPRMAFSDIAGHWAAEEIEKWSARGVINGSGGQFRPDDGLTLAELATVYTRVLPLGRPAENTFTDLNEDEWYAEAVLRCVGAGIIDAGAGGEIGADRRLTRAEAFVTAARAFGLSPAQGETRLGGYSDAGDLAPEDRPYFEALLGLDLVSGGGEARLDPGGSFTRADAVDLLERAERAGLITWR